MRVRAGLNKGAFYNCTNLKSVTFGENSKLSAIKGFTFYNCIHLINIKIPDSVTEIGKEAFRYCSSLERIQISDSIKHISEGAFDNCTSLTSVYITNIASWCSVDFDGLTANPLSYAHYLYLNNELITALEIPDSVTSIGIGAFYRCESIESVTFGENSQLTSIGKYAFYRCTSLKEIEIPQSVTSVGYWAFCQCTGLESVSFGEDSKLTLIDEWAFSECKKLNSITIPASVELIGVYAFEDCESLTSVIFENTSGWTAGDTVISSSDLQNPALAAEYLMGTYYKKEWTRS